MTPRGPALFACAVALALAPATPAAASSGDPLRCGVVRDNFNRADSTNPGALWTETAPDMQINQLRATSFSTTGAPLMTYKGTQPNPLQACVTIAAPSSPVTGAYAGVVLGQNTAATKGYYVQFEDRSSPADGKFDSIVYYRGNHVGTADVRAVAPFAAARVLVAVNGVYPAANPPYGNSFSVRIDTDFDGDEDNGSGTTFAIDGGDGTGIGLTAFGGATLDDFATISAGPVVAGGSTPAQYAEGGAPIVVDPAVTVSDADDANLEGARVTLASGIPGERLLFANTSKITANSPNSVLVLSGTATVAEYQAALRSVRFELTSDNPPAGDRTVYFQVDDGDSTGVSGTQKVTVTPTNDAPTLTATAGALDYVENAAAVVIDPGLTVLDPDTATLTGASVRIANGVQAGDALGFATQNGIAGSYADGVLTLSGSATTAQYQTALRSVTFRSDNDAPVAAKAIEFRASDGSLESAAAMRSLTTTPVDDAPTVTTTATALGYQQGSSPILVDPGVTVTDVDDAGLEGATIALSDPTASDVLAFTPQSGITGSYSAGTLTLTGAATLPDYQAALRSVTFSSGSAAPSRTITFRGNDGELQSAPAVRQIGVVAAPASTPTPTPTPTITASPSVGTTPTVTATPPAGPALKLSGVALGAKRVRRSGAVRLRFTLNRGATVTLSFTRKKARRTVTRSFAGAGSFAIAVKGRRLGLGGWTVAVTATAAGETVTGPRLSFRVVKRR